jgi:hypothetical protein
MSAASNTWKVNDKSRMQSERHCNVVHTSTTENNDSQQDIYCVKASNNTALA